jgi:HSP20 family molecular chaperone IbpA
MTLLTSNNLLRRSNNLFAATLDTLDSLSSHYPLNIFDPLTKTKDGYTLTLNMAGYKKDHINVKWNDSYLTVKTEIKYKDGTSHSTISSYYVGPIDHSKTEAKLEDGILTVKVISTEQVKPVDITIN